MRTILLSLLLLCLGAMELKAGGYQLNLFGIRQIGMAHIGTPLARDAAGMALNPGSTGFLPRSEVIGGSGFTFINTAYQAPAPSTYETSTEPAVNFPFNFHGVYRRSGSGFGAGVSVYTPYGNSVVWPEGWKNQFFLQQISLQTVYIQPTVGYQYNEVIGIGGGLIYGIGAVNLQRNLPVADQDGNYGRAELDGSTSAVGYTVGLMARPVPEFHMGVSYRSQLDMDVEEGTAEFRVPASLEASFPPDNTFSASLPLPWVLSFGMGFDINDQITLAAQADLTGWSAYERLLLDFGENTEALQDSDGPRHYEDSWIYRLGGSYQWDENTTFRAGTYLDRTPVQDGYMTPETPDADRFGFSAGVTRQLTDRLAANLSVLHIRAREREQTAEEVAQAGTQTDVPTGTFRTLAWIPGVSFSFSL